MPVDITEITGEDDGSPEETVPAPPAPSAEEKKSASTGFQLIQDAEAAMAKVATTLAKGVASAQRATSVLRLVWASSRAQLC